MSSRFARRTRKGRIVDKIVMECPQCGIRFDARDTAVDGQGATCPDCGGIVPVFDQPTITNSPALTPPPPPPPPAASEIQPTIGGYQILGKIGEGGMGVVLEGLQTSLDRKVAIKVLAPRLAQDVSLVARFEREVAALVRLSHPHIVTIFDQGRSAESHVYYIMEYVEGEGGGPPKDLQQLIDDGGSIDSHRTRALMLEVVEALGFAHREGVIHRDIKPGNILVDRNGYAKVADFGIACMKTVDQPARVTMENTPVGTMVYMAPEQLQNAAAVDHRADIYSTGVMLYQILTRQLPFPGYDLPSEAVPGLHSGWDAIIQKALQANPENRFADMAEFEKMLKELPLDDPDHGAATNVGTGSPTTITSAGSVCPSCSSQISEEDQFCVECGCSLWIDCRGCGKKVLAGAKFCPSCRADIQQIRLFEEHLTIGKECLAQGQGEGPSIVRVQNLEQARLALTKALTFVSNDETARQLLEEANQRSVEATKSTGEDALKASTLR